MIVGHTRWVWHLSMLLVLAAAAVVAVMAVRGHDVGGEVWGLVAAVLAVGASIATRSALRSGRRIDRLASGSLWLVVIGLGISGAFDHAAAVLPEYLDQRARPPLMPLVFVLLGGIGLALLAGRPGRSEAQRGKEAA